MVVNLIFSFNFVGLILSIYLGQSVTPWIPFILGLNNVYHSVNPMMIKTKQMSRSVIALFTNVLASYMASWQTK